MIIFDLRILGNDWLKSELLDITRDWVSSSGMHCQAFIAADFSCCLWVFLPLVLSSARSSNEEFSTFTFKNSCLAFGVCFGSSSSCTIKRRPINFAAFNNNNNNNNNLLHLYSAFIDTQSALHSKGVSPHPPPVCSIHLMIRRQP